MILPKGRAVALRGRFPIKPSARQERRNARVAWGFPPLRGLLPLALAAAVWEIVGSAGSPLFPPPSEWIRALLELWVNGRMGSAVIATVVTFVIGLGSATVVGAVVGLLIGYSRLTERALAPALEFARVMPPAAIVPVAVLLLGYEQTMKVAVVTVAAVWPVLLHTRAGVRSLDPVLLDTARSLRLGRLESIRKVVFPALLPSVFVGVRLATSISIIITLLVEIVTQVDGIGALIAISQRTYMASEVYGLIVVVALFSLLVNGLVSVCEGYVLRNRPG